MSLLLAFVLAVGVDTASTCVGLSRGMAEANPLYGSHPTCGRVIAINAATTGVVVLFAPKAKGRARKTTRWLMGVTVGVRSVAVTWNLVQMSR